MIRASMTRSKRVDVGSSPAARAKPYLDAPAACEDCRRSRTRRKGPKSSMCKRHWLRLSRWLRRARIEWLWQGATVVEKRRLLLRWRRDERRAS